MKCTRKGYQNLSSKCDLWLPLKDFRYTLQAVEPSVLIKSTLLIYMASFHGFCITLYFCFASDDSICVGFSVLYTAHNFIQRG